jgi:hypothetical protein
VAKQVTMLTRPRPREADLDAFVHGRDQPEPAAPTPPRVRMKRLTFDVPADLHLRMKIGCAQEGRDMADVLRELIAQRWP